MDDKQLDKTILRKLRVNVSFPWLSSCVAILLITFLVAKPDLQAWLTSIADSGTAKNYSDLILPILFSASFSYAIAGVFLLTLVWDGIRFDRNRKHAHQQAERLKQEVRDVWDSKKHLQHKAHTYSGHADKLKLFISDKLLEYIEYDEKFLHFKNIASEVRHNGVISFDIVKAALINAKQNASTAEMPERDSSAYDKALLAMRYLWDLLDLSTADNMALHIASRLAEAEEHYYQKILNAGSDAEQGSELLDVDYSPAQAVIDTLLYLVQEPEQLEQTQGQSEGEDEGYWQYSDKQLNIVIRTQPGSGGEGLGQMLGNRNYLRLIVENLCKNAMHFSRKVPYKQKSDRIFIELVQSQYAIRVNVINRGPIIEEDEKDKILQLGYSSRRSRGHHGKGLGLFFVNEIIKGYEGQLGIQNIQNKDMSYAIRFEFENGDILSKIVHVKVQQDIATVIEEDSGSESLSSREIGVSSGQGESQLTQLDWQFEHAVKRIELSSNERDDVQIIELAEDLRAGNVSAESPRSKRSKVRHIYYQKGIGVYLPAWCLTYQEHSKKLCNVGFSTLDIKGVHFQVSLPTAQARLDGIDLEG